MSTPEAVYAAINRLRVTGDQAFWHADYQHHADGRDWHSFLPETVDYMVHRHFDEWVREDA